MRWVVAAGVGAAAVVAGLVLVIVPTALAVTLTGGAFGDGASGVGTGEIPPAYQVAFTSSARRFSVPWGILAGIYRRECDFGRSPLPGCAPATENAAGAQGPGQFLPTTWRSGLPPMAIIPPGPPAPPGGGEATDGDGDGIADPFDPADAVASTARMLAADGVATDPAGAVGAYDHDPTYVAAVLAYAADHPGPAAGAGPAAVAYALARLGTPYLWGGTGAGGFDCSGLVQAAYADAGVDLPRTAAEQWAATASAPVALDAVQPGDLVFFGPSPGAIDHVGIAVDGAAMVDAPHTGAVVRVESFAWADLLGATRPGALRP